MACIENFRTKAPLIILEMGFEYGSNLANAISGTSEGSKVSAPNLDLPEEFAPAPPKLVAALLGEAVKRVGWGVLSMSGDLEKGTSISFIIDNCGFCVEASSSRYPCNFFRGATLGIATKFYMRQYVSSTSCLNQNGAHRCRINLVGK